jgi:hypothetical protein
MNIAFHGIGNKIFNASALPQALPYGGRGNVKGGN